MTQSTTMVEVEGSPFAYDSSLNEDIQGLEGRIEEMRSIGKLSPDALRHIRNHFRMKNIYHSNAIEGNLLDIGETRQVVEMGLTIAGKPLRDQAEAKNLGTALDFLEDLARDTENPITCAQIKQIHLLILRGIDDQNAGVYRMTDVKISGSDYEPPNHFKLQDEMDRFDAWLRTVSGGPGVIQTAAAVHAWFAQNHPFIDGNGRAARILMNLVLMRAGYPIAIVAREDRHRYYDALEESQVGDLTPFIGLVIESVSETLEEYEDAADEQRSHNEWAQSIASRFNERQLVKVKNEYELWRSAMELMLNHYRTVVEDLNDATPYVRIYIKEFGMLEFEKYAALRQRQAVKRTWFFRVDFREDERTARYMHTFRWADRALSEHSQVSLRLGREEFKQYQFEWLDDITRPNVPSLREIAYSPSKETFVSMNALRHCQEAKIEDIARRFFDEVMRCHFQN